MGEIETYTFSRALHLMRYGGKRMSPLGDDWVYFVDGGILYIITGRYPNGNGHVDLANPVDSLDPFDVMGSWIEVKK